MLKRLLMLLGVSALITSAAANTPAPAPASAQAKPYVFGVINQRSPVLDAQYWNPILRYVSQKSGVPLVLRMGKTAVETSAMVKRREFDFVYSNHIFSPENEASGYKVFARPEGNTISGQIVVLSDSPIQSLADLQGKDVAFPSQVAFVGYFVPMDALLRAGISVNKVFAGNQEGAIGQLKAGRVVAAAVNSKVMRDFAEREKIGYRILWGSEEYRDIPLAALPTVPKEKVDAVRDAFVSMAATEEGAAVLKASAELIKKPLPHGFVAAKDSEFDNYRKFFKHTLIKGD